MVKESSPTKRKMGCLVWGGVVLGGLVFIPVILLVAGYVFQLRTTTADFDAFPAPGQLVDVGGYNLHIVCQGEGNPTVVIDAGNGDFSLGWSLVQPGVAEFTRICTYDRAGYGWSEPGSGPRTAEQMANELHTLLSNAGIAGPFVLVGHSLGGYNVRMYAELYPEEVAGMVLVDAGHEDQLTRLPSEYIQITQQQNGYMFVMRLMARFGILRLLGQSAGEQALPPHIQRLPEDIKDVYVTMLSHPSYFDATLKEFQALEETCSQVRMTGNLGDRPLAVLTAGNSVDVETLQSIGLPPDFPIDQIQPIWLTLQQELALLSSKSMHLVIEDSGHAIHIDRPDLVIDTIEQIVKQVREETP